MSPVLFVVLFFGIALADKYPYGLSPNDKFMFMIVDVQNCFVPGGTLPVGGGDEVVPVINSIRQKWHQKFKMVAVSQDWHCEHHVSFASEHPGFGIFSTIDLKYTADGRLCYDEETNTTNPTYTADCTNEVVAHVIPQTLWPDHCVMGTEDANLLDNLITSHKDVLVRKGDKCYVDSYSTLYDNGGFTHTDLPGIIQKRGITAAFVVGLATDFCVSFTSEDMATKLGLKTFLVEDATRQISQELRDAAYERLTAEGVHWINSNDVDDIFNALYPQ
jgi:nicotinamidase/pyrazinamidase